MRRCLTATADRATASRPRVESIENAPTHSRFAYVNRRGKGAARRHRLLVQGERPRRMD